MGIDIIVLILFIMALFKGLRKGLVIALFSFLAFFIGLAAALKLSAVVAAYLGHSTSISQKWLPVIAFALVFFVVALLVRQGAKLLEGIIRVAMLGWLNKTGGVILYLFIYLFIFSLLLFYASQLHLIKPETAVNSVTYAYIQPMGPKMINAIGTIIPVFRDMFSELLLFFQNVSDTKQTVQ
jgi:membrane protein required for colicin V production